MRRFLGSLKLRALTPAELRSAQSSVQLWELLEPYMLELDHVIVTAPPGFTSDFASIPRLVSWYIDDDDPRILPGSILHDFVYSRRGILDDRRMTREDADAMLREAMLLSGARPSMAWAVYQSVRLGGASHWR